MFNLQTSTERAKKVCVFCRSAVGGMVSKDKMISYKNVREATTVKQVNSVVAHRCSIGDISYSAQVGTGTQKHQAEVGIWYNPI